MKKSLLIVVDEKRMGGVSILLEDMIRLGIFENYDTDLLVLHNNGSMFENIKNVKILYGSSYFNAVDFSIKEIIKNKNIKFLFSKIRLVFDMKTGIIKRKIKKERKKILKKHYDIEIAFKDGFTALFTIFGDSDKKIHWLHYEYGNANPNKKYDKLFQNIMPKFNKIVAVSKGVKEAFLKIYNVENVDVIPNLVDKNKIISMSHEESIIPYKKDKINIISVGRIHSVKGYDRLLKALNRLKEENINSIFNVNIIGDGPDTTEIKKMSDSLNLDVKFWGQMNNPYKEIKNADILILPSRYESFGLVVVEAMILHIPVLATKTAATEKLIDNGITGLIVENSEHGIYNGLKNLALNKDKIAMFKRNLNDYCYDLNQIIKKIKELLEEC